MLAEKTQLQIFDPDAETFVTTDASNVGLGALLSRRQSPQDPEQPIAFFNKALDSSERSYDATEREGLACLKGWNIGNISSWVELSPCHDHEAPKGIYGGTGKHRRQTSKFKFIRWKERLSAYDFKILNIPGPWILWQTTSAICRHKLHSWNWNSSRLPPLWQPSPSRIWL